MILDFIAVVGPWGWLIGALIASLAWAPKVLSLQELHETATSALEQECMRRENAQERASQASESLVQLRRQTQDLQRQLHELTRYNGRRVEHEGGGERCVRATVLGWYKDRQKPCLMIRTEAQPGRPSIAYGVPMAQCRFIDDDAKATG